MIFLMAEDASAFLVFSKLGSPDPKIHIRSGKLTLLRYDDFDGKALPELQERIKIKMREQDIEFFSYGGEYPEQYLYLKSRYLAPDCPGYDRQVAFDRSLEATGAFDFSGFGRPAHDSRLCLDGQGAGRE